MTVVLQLSCACNCTGFLVKQLLLYCGLRALLFLVVVFCMAVVVSSYTFSTSNGVIKETYGNPSVLKSPKK